jgi:hypothetical protein
MYSCFDDDETSLATAITLDYPVMSQAFLTERLGNEQFALRERVGTQRFLGSNHPEITSPQTSTRRPDVHVARTLIEKMPTF